MLKEQGQFLVWNTFFLHPLDAKILSEWKLVILLDHCSMSSLERVGDHCSMSECRGHRASLSESKKPFAIHKSNYQFYKYFHGKHCKFTKSWVKHQYVLISEVYHLPLYILFLTEYTSASSGYTLIARMYQCILVILCFYLFEDRNFMENIIGPYAWTYRESADALERYPNIYSQPVSTY